MARYLVAYLVAAVVMAAFDLAWLGYAVKAFFEPAVGSLLSAKTNMTAAVLFYILYIVGICLFAIGPGLRGGGWAAALFMGAAFGFFAYMTYDLTNMATLKVWPAHLAAIDIAWGTFVTGIAALAGYSAASRLA
ncbi:MAG TPA: DUF2177 family protein [Rhizomicrobium sp.]|nr:DUF2177 family protein [Rhizomicrobium sp.]